MKSDPEEPSEQIATKGLDVRASDTSWGFKGHNYLLIIGIDKYQHWRTLNCAVKDVQDFKQVLIDRYQFDEAFVYTLLNENATRQAIWSMITKLMGIITADDNLLVYFSGHGHYDEATRTGYWIPVDAEVGNEKGFQFIDTAQAVDWLRKINSLHTFLIVDACFSGTILFKGPDAPKSERYKSRLVLASGRAEVVRDGPKGGNSPFAKGLLYTLTKNTEKFISASRIILEVKEYVPKESRQEPTDGRLDSADDEGGDFVFHLKMTESEIWASVVQQDSFNIYQKFIEQFPESKHLAEAKEAMDWLHAREQNTKQSLSNYLRQLDEGQSSEKYRNAAIQALYLIEEQKCWEKTSTQDTLNSYFEYLSKFKAGSHAKEANNRIEELLRDPDDIAFKKALDEDSVDAINEYLEKPGEKKYQQEAEKKVTAIEEELDEISREESAWEKASVTGTYGELNNFVQAYPASRFIAEAQQRMKTLDDVAWKEIQFLEFDKSLSLEDKVNRCIAYFDSFPGADNNVNVKQIKDEFELESFRKQGTSLNAKANEKNGTMLTAIKDFFGRW